MLPVEGDLPGELWFGAPVGGCEAIPLAIYFFEMDLSWTDFFFIFTILVYSDDQE